MMGFQTDSQKRLFYSFNLEDHIPQNYLLRGIDQCLDLSELRQHLASCYSHTGRPSIDPELMIRMLIVGYSYGIRSERRLCEEVHLNLAYHWFCRLGLEDAVPDHSTFSKNRHVRFRVSGTFRWVFDEVVRRCMAAGLVKAEGFAVDASIIAAAASGPRGHIERRGTRLDQPCAQQRALRRNWRPFRYVRTHITKADTIIYRSRQSDCADCPMKARCCPNTPFRKIARSVHEAARDVTRRIATTPAYQRSRRERKKVGVLFAHLKRIPKLERLRLRGLAGATVEFTLAAAVQNLHRMAKVIAQGPPFTG